MRAFELALQPDKIRLIRFGRNAAKQREMRGEGEPETFDFLGFTHFCTRSRTRGVICHRAQDHQEADASQAQGNQGGVAQAYARPHRDDRSLGEAGAARASELLRGLGQSPEPVVVLQPGEGVLAQVAQATQSESESLLGALHPARGSLLPANQGATPAASSPLRRQNPREEPGALAAHAGICAGGEE
jgi:hypothetical protein